MLWRYTNLNYNSGIWSNMSYNEIITIKYFYRPLTPCPCGHIFAHLGHSIWIIENIKILEHYHNDTYYSVILVWLFHQLLQTTSICSKSVTLHACISHISIISSHVRCQCLTITANTRKIHNAIGNKDGSAHAHLVEFPYTNGRPGYILSHPNLA